jgi:hypothetical protein
MSSTVELKKWLTFQVYHRLQKEGVFMPTYGVAVFF